MRKISDNSVKKLRSGDHSYQTPVLDTTFSRCCCESECNNSNFQLNLYEDQTCQNKKR